MPRDDQNDVAPAAKPSSNPAAGAAVPLGRTFRGEASPPITTPEAVAAAQARSAAHAVKPGAVALQVYFVARGISNPILQASMLAYTDVRIAPVEDFDEIFVEHHEVPVVKLDDDEPTEARSK